ncbi:MAG: BON domain-containing protein [Bdellovibrionota bacterium]
MKTDSKIQTDVLKELTWDPAVNQTHIGISVAKGIVTLTGSVSTYAEKLAAEKAAQRVEGVRGIAEKIKVKLPDFFQRTDEDIAAAAAEALRWHVQVPEEKIKVVVQKGGVELTGTVEWEFQKAAAEEAVKNLMGVTWVLNNIEIRSNINPANVKKQIELALKRTAEREAKRIKVEVKGGKVILSGKVRSFAELRSARGAAWSAPGVTQVESNLSLA